MVGERRDIRNLLATFQTTIRICHRFVKPSGDFLHLVILVVQLRADSFDT